MQGQSFQYLTYARRLLCVGAHTLSGLRVTTSGVVPINSAMCRATWTADPLWALVPAAGGATQREASTHRSSIHGKRLLVNVRTRNHRAELRVELLDDNGNVLPGFAREDCKPVTGDHHAVAVEWTGGRRAPAAAVQTRFVLRRAFLYGFDWRNCPVWFSEPPGDGPWFHVVTDLSIGGTLQMQTLPSGTWNDDVHVCRLVANRPLPGWRKARIVAWLFIGMTLLRPCGSCTLFAQVNAGQRSKVLALGVDYNDQVVIGYRGGYLYNEPKIRELIQTAKKAGFDEIYWRVSVIGKVSYRSRVMSVMDGAWTPYPEASPIGIILKQCDPLAVAIDETHKQGMKLFVYVTLFDFAYPGFENAFFEKHPEYWSRLAGVLADNVAKPLPGHEQASGFSATVKTGGYSKSLVEGQRQGTAPYVRGVPSFGYQEVRQYLLAQVKELIEYKPDGVYFDVARTHAGIYPVLSYGWYPQWTSPYIKYGYNEPEIQLYMTRYGKKPPLRDPISLQSLKETEDEKNWNAVRGHFVTLFMRDAARLLHEANMEAAVGFYPKSNNGFQPGTYTRQQVGRIDIQWKTWCDEGYTDAIHLITDHRKHGYDDWEAASANIYRYAQDKGVRVYVGCSLASSWDKLKRPPAPLPITRAKQPELYFQVLADVTRNILDSSADGVFYYEAGDNGPPTWNSIRRASER